MKVSNYTSFTNHINSGNSISLRAQYAKEREGFETIETEDGFVEYKFFEKEVYVRDVYIVPSKRKLYKASELVARIEAIGKQKGCEYLSTSVTINARNVEDSIRAILSYGFKVLRSEPSLIWFFKSLTSH